MANVEHHIPTTIHAKATVIFVIVVVLAAYSTAYSAASASPSTTTPPIEWNAKLQGSFIVSLCRDLDGRIWVGTEDMGVWCWDSQKAENEIAKKQKESKESKEKTKSAPPGWTHYTRELTGAVPEKSGPVIQILGTCLPSLGDDNAYAIACDKLGRIWVGHLNHGVSVFNGKEWRNYDVITGPLGERVFDIKTCPVDGDVWIATSAGLTRYRMNTDSWSYYTREDGLPSDQIQCMAFDKNGTLYAGTQCDGLAICEPDSAPVEDDAAKLARVTDKADVLKTPDKTTTFITKTAPKLILEYSDWRQVTTPGNSYEMPLEPLGEGLPSNLINDILVAKDGSIFVATTTGLARSKDKGKSWDYVRGGDWEAKTKGLYRRPSAKQLEDARKMVSSASQTLLLEDFCTCLAEDTKGMIWIGHRDKPFEVIDPKTEKRVNQDKEQANPAVDGFVKVILPLPKEMMLIGKYGGGSKKLESPPPSRPRSISPPKLPSPAKPPSVEELNALLKRIQSDTATPKKLENAYLGEDWTTWGDWVGHYGRQYNVLCAAATPFNHNLVWDNQYSISAQIDTQYSQKDKGDNLRGWIQWAETRNPRTLYDPIAGVRRQSEWDDHGEAYSPLREGPNINVMIKVPEGVHRISAYFFNKDGHSRKNRFRDYILSINQQSSNGVSDSFKPLGTARVNDHWGGVYKQFVVTGPGNYVFYIERNHSHNANVSGVFIDKLAGPITYYDDLPIAFLGGIKFKAPSLEPPDENEDNVVRRARILWDAAVAARSDPSRVYFCRLCQLMAYRSAVSANAGSLLLRNWRWNLCLWTADDREEFAQTMDQGWEKQITCEPKMIWQKTRRPQSNNSPVGKQINLVENNSKNKSNVKDNNSKEKKQK